MTSLVFHPHNKRIGYRAKRKPSWKVLHEFVNEELMIFVAVKRSLKEKVQ